MDISKEWFTLVKKWTNSLEMLSFLPWLGRQLMVTSLLPDLTELNTIRWDITGPVSFKMMKKTNISQFLLSSQAKFIQGMGSVVKRDSLGHQETLLLLSLLLLTGIFPFLHQLWGV